jgi:hypothetical protein
MKVTIIGTHGMKIVNEVKIIGTHSIKTTKSYLQESNPHPRRISELPVQPAIWLSGPHWESEHCTQPIHQGLSSVIVFSPNEPEQHLRRRNPVRNDSQVVQWTG